MCLLLNRSVAHLAGSFTTVGHFHTLSSRWSLWQCYPGIPRQLFTRQLLFHYTNLPDEKPAGPPCFLGKVQLWRELDQHPSKLQYSLHATRFNCLETLRMTMFSISLDSSSPAPLIQTHTECYHRNPYIKATPCPQWVAAMQDKHSQASTQLSPVLCSTTSIISTKAIPLTTHRSQIP